MSKNVNEWYKEKALLKQEGKQINIGLGRETAIHTFNKGHFLIKCVIKNTVKFQTKGGFYGKWF